MATTAPARLDLAERLTRLHQVPTLSEEHARRLELLKAKLEQEQFVLAFCGHFSAGKSTLINQLAGSHVLPSGPIPTSANQVLLRHGEAGATVRFRDGSDLDLPSAGLQRLAEFCADGEQVESVEIRHPLAHVPEGVWLMDTPGIDSTDEAHRLVTESALYLADAVCYVMDYNHVQSEVNLAFTRTLAEWGKPLCLIVNQVDKHVDLEIPFVWFRQSVIEAFAARGVHPDGLFFTSLREPEHARNEWGRLLERIDALSRNRQQLLLSGVWNSALHLMKEEERLRAPAEAALRASLEQEAVAGGSDPHVRRAVLALETERLSGVPEQTRQDLNREIGAILANAPIWPYEVKELAAQYLQARRPGFRAGLFASAARTGAEVERRLQAFYGALSELVQAHIHWHLQDLLLRAGEAQAGRHAEFEAAVRGLAVPLGPEALADLVKPQALPGDEYRHQYGRDVAEEVRLRYRRAVQPLVDPVVQMAAARGEREAEPLRAEARRLAQAIAATEQLTALEDAARARKAAWSEILGENPATRPAAPEPPREQAAEGPPTETHTAVSPTLAPTAAVPSAPAPAIEGQALRQDAACRLQDAVRLLAPLPGMARVAADLEQRAVRLGESSFTVALFGAFSAGKSSFANALMGIPLLPVSPNPTTAVITRIAPPEPGRPHGHVRVRWQNPEGTGGEEIIGLQEFAGLVADEQRASRVREITVHVDCPLTRQGITLVDTPGADSINTRHTDVAFDYIKNADAILFVTYYNHAFSRADREFLEQLGRVKDAFALDKMFFLVNAADLAQDPGELDLVMGHVRSNLQACGIRQARIFPVSSQTALWSRLQAAGRLPRELAARLQGRPESGMDRFEEAFYRFVVTDLSQMAVEGAFAEVRRAGRTIAGWLEAARTDEGARTRRLQEMRGAATSASTLLAALDPTPEVHELQREIDELLYYVRRRVLLERFGDQFAQAFNPTVLRQDSPDLKRALREALQEVIDVIAFDLAQEMRATALRVENAVNRQAERVAQRAVAAITSHLPNWSSPPHSPVHPPVPAFSNGRDHLSPEPFRHLLAQFRSPERFFAGGERHQLCEALARALEEPVAAYLAAARDTLSDWYGSAFAGQVAELRTLLAADVADHLHGLTAALTGAGESEQLEAIWQRLISLA
jgi:GTPase Era involved in 16S rRNA processing